MRLFAIAALAVGICGLGAEVHAQCYSNSPTCADVIGGPNDNFTQTDGSGPESLSTHGGGVNTWSYVDYDPSPVLHTQVSSSGTGGQAYASLLYYVSVVGPSDITVPLDLLGFTWTEGNTSDAGSGGGWISEASFTIGNSVVNVIDSSIDYNPIGYNIVDQHSGYNPETYSNIINIPFSVSANYSQSIFLDVYASVGGTTAAFATIDPTIQIDPEFLVENPGYSLVFSPGIGNTPVSAAPEPSSWLLMILGLGAAGGLLRRRDDILSLSRRVVVA